MYIFQDELHKQQDEWSDVSVFIEKKLYKSIGYSESVYIQEPLYSFALCKKKSKRFSFWYAWLVDWIGWRFYLGNQIPSLHFSHWHHNLLFVIKMASYLRQFCSSHHQLLSAIKMLSQPLKMHLLFCIFTKII